MISTTKRWRIPRYKLIQRYEVLRTRLSDLDSQTLSLSLEPSGLRTPLQFVSRDRLFNNFAVNAYAIGHDYASPRMSVVVGNLPGTLVDAV